jgi:hypothetical protein
MFGLNPAPMKHLAEYLVTRAVGAMASCLPHAARLAIGRSLGSLVYALDARHRKITLANVEWRSAKELAGSRRRRGAFSISGPCSSDVNPRRHVGRQPSSVRGIERLEARRRPTRASSGAAPWVGAHGGAWLPSRNSLVAREGQSLPSTGGSRRSGDFRQRVVYKSPGQMRELMREGERCHRHDQNVHLQDRSSSTGGRLRRPGSPGWFALSAGRHSFPRSATLSRRTLSRGLREPVDFSPIGSDRTPRSPP